MTRVMVVEDNDNMRRGLCDLLEADGFETIEIADGKQAVDAMHHARPDLVILDLMLPAIDGAGVLEKMRASGVRAPVLVLTAKNDEDEKVRLLEMGADDYVTKPFGRRELGARISALLRRAPLNGREVPDVIRIGDVCIDLRSRVVTRAEAVVPLSPKEYALLVALAEHAGTAMTRAALLHEVWGYRSGVMSRTVDLHILELRRRLERDPAHPELIVTVRTVGYRMSGTSATLPDRGV